MSYIYDDKLKTAYEKSDELLKNIFYDKSKMIPSKSIINEIEKNYCKEVNVNFGSFSDANIKYTEKHSIMKITFNELNEPIKADILLNTDSDNIHQRFALVHELGHLVTKIWESDKRYFDKYKGIYIVSDSNFIIDNSDKNYYDNLYMLNEKIADIFALRILMPSEQFYKKLEYYEDIRNVARFFGVTNDAVISRMKIGD